MDDEPRAWGVWALAAFMALSLGYRSCLRGEPWVAPARVADVPGLAPLVPREPGFAALLEGRRVDLNRAPDAVLQQLPGIGPRLSERIRAARARRPFVDLRDLMRVRGLGPRSVQKLAPLVRFAPPPRAQGESAAGEGTGGKSLGAPATGS